MSERTPAELLEEHGLSPEILADPVLNRRGFLAALGGGIAILLTFDRAPAQETEGRPLRGATRQEPAEIDGWLHIGQDGAVTAYVGKVELGQNARTSLTQVVAEELRLAPEAVRLVMGDTALTPFDMGTFGSRTTPATVPPLRRASAAAREVLLDLATAQLKADRGKLVMADGKVTDPASGRSAGFGELTKGQNLVQSIPANVPVTPPSQWKTVGQSVRKVDAASIVTGSKKYASDMKRPNMLRGKVLRPPTLNATLKSCDTAAAAALPGTVVCRDGGFVGVAAPTDAAAGRALAAIHAEWDLPAQISPQELLDHLRKTAGAPARGGGSRGSVEAGLAQASVTLKQTYTVSYLAHAAIEPRSAVAEWNGENLTVWAATQSPFGVRGELSQTLGIPESRIRVIGLDTGNGYGGKTRCQAAVEAARIAKTAGKPVRVAWTREEEMARNHFRPAGIIDVRSGAKADGTLVAWEFRNYNSGPAGLPTPYDVPNQIVEFLPCEGPWPQGAYRALAAPANFFARESHMDELAQELKLDPLEFRLKNASDTRLRAVVQTAAQHFGWGAQPATGRGFGLACGFEKGGYVGSCVEVSVEPATRQVHVERVVTAFDCGAVINPLQLRNQIEGGATMALGGALFEAIEFGEGRILNPTFATYRLPRFSDLPKIEAVLIDRKDVPSAGAGETPTCAIAAAIGNAIFRATGVRLRALPLVPNGVPA